ncbi:Fc.00g066990.m01.CDS01 [Cosmosporella sp. VM-42]
MANGLDRLERLFGKRKASTASTDSGEPIQAVLPTAIPVTEPQFPSPSFIRPKATRMAAREEVRVKQPAGRTPSFPEGHSPQRMTSINTQYSTSSSGSYRLNHSPLRLSSLKPLQPQSTIVGFHDFKFPRPPTHSGETSPASSSNTNSPFEHSGERSPRFRSSKKPNVAPPRLDTPPTSDPEDEELHGSRYFRNKKLPKLPHGAPPTPSPSPELRPALEPQLRESKSIEILNTSVYRDIHRQLGEPFEYPPLRRALSQSSLAPSSSRLSLSSSALREPAFNEFLNLSDDDIAEDSLDSPILPPLRELPPASTMLTPAIASPLSQPLLTLTPPYASRPAAAAAFEAARIAKRYNFDLVYVVNLWPDKARPQTSSPDHDDSASFNSDFSTGSSKGLTGRLLAAYGLENVKSPFQISALVHGKILRSDGWIEYRNHEACNDEFARGYACAFYTGRYSRNGSITSTSASSTKAGKVDRGIVFAAYRKPRADGAMLGVCSDKDELANVYQDAETLVEMLIDIHVANRLRQPQSHPQGTDETGPMPVQRLWMR